MKKIIATLLLAALAATAFTGCSNDGETVSVAEATEPELRDEQGVGYNTLEDGTLTTIAAKKTVSSVKISSEYNGKKVTEIGKSTFKMADVVTVEIEKGITQIDDYAFAFCRNLKEIDIPEGVTKIGKNGFAGCTKLKKITIPSTLEEIGMFAFDATAVKKLEIPKGVKKIGEFAFAQCENLTEIKFNSKDIEIAENVFNESPNVKIIAPKKSTAEKLAKSKGIEFEEN